MAFNIVKSEKTYKILAVIFTIAMWTLMVIDDWNFVLNYWRTNFVEYLATWFIYYLIYFLAFSLIYWGIVLLLYFIFLITNKISQWKH